MHTRASRRAPPPAASTSPRRSARQQQRNSFVARRQPRRRSSDARDGCPAAGSATPRPCRPRHRRSPASPLPRRCLASSARGRHRASAPPPCSICLGHQERQAQALCLAGRPSSPPAAASLDSAVQRSGSVAQFSESSNTRLGLFLCSNSSAFLFLTKTQP